MKIEVKIKKTFDNEKSPLKAVANIIIDDCFAIHNAKLIDGGNGLFIYMPSYRGRDRKWRSICHPITSECRKLMQDSLIEAYNQR